MFIFQLYSFLLERKGLGKEGALVFLEGGGLVLFIESISVRDLGEEVDEIC